MEEEKGKEGAESDREMKRGYGGMEGGERKEGGYTQSAPVPP